VKILMTGGTGFVGQWMQKEAPIGAEITALSHAQYDAGDWEQSDYDYIVHLAPILPDRVINHVRNRWTGARVLFASSGAVYHTELNDYGRMKLESEAMLKDSGIDFISVRMFAFMGAFMKRETKAIGCFIRDAVAGGPIHIQGDGSAIRSYLYGQDMAQWLWRALLRGESGTAYDVGSEYGVTILDLASMIADKFNGVNIQIHNAIEREQAPVYLPVDVYKTKNQLKVIENFYLSQMIDLTIEAYKIEQNTGN
jgi:nucleoside-diphosphate-sugar epimerase